MLKRHVILTAFLMLLAGGRFAAAQTIGPYCFQPQPFVDVFAMYLTPSGPGQFSVTGANLLTNSSLHGMVALRGGVAQISFEALIPPSGGAHTFMGTADFSLGTLSGPGRCETVNTTGGCGLGTAITLRLVACPTGANPEPAAKQPGAGGGGGE